ncbi:methylmalonyl-CoA mutase subunit beta [Dactylosporangium aurantiacum]|uniref:methylmalonyl-CoA mutase n=1 Tax=Dactylosporangium aurantiacum TaxID=35754 RepID=A0A9Q9IRG6_9ACTN|nr:methylmalonyl-CoA mutase subunit beta [Dactylosporangium aurantiacum]MDG6109133.1 methylmalonyl-CoA mutase subunit beta [Dactylosporangium aurantiacum]UWZ58462.1 methylmalonyl-CoA mutase subunit beta [Dactylosporangium aurantiacum]
MSASNLAQDSPLSAWWPAAAHREWCELAAAALTRGGSPDTDGTTVEALLSTTTYDGVEIRPLYTAGDDGRDGTGVPGLPPFVRGGTTRTPLAGGWQLRQHHAQPDPDRGRQAVIADLDAGVTSLWLRVGPGALPVTDIGAVLGPLDPARHTVVLDAGDALATAAQELLRIDPGVAGGLGADPLGLRARTGRSSDPTVADDLAVRCARAAPGLRAYTVDATVYHDAGGGDAEELGCALAVAVAYLRRMTASGLSVDEAFGQIEFRFAATADQFATIAKLRAARRLWWRVAQECGASPDSAAQRQHAVTSGAMMTTRDPWGNVLRTTVGCFGAAVGGADAVTVQPFDTALRLPDEQARRIARNTSSILLQEAHLGRVLDPAGGSWYVGELTGELAQAAWSWFAEIERAGGADTAWESGLLARRLAATWQRRAEDLAHRRETVTGVTDFPLLSEAPPGRPAATAAEGGLPRHRYAEDFEALRDRSDAWLAAHGERPAVFLAAFGPGSAGGPRAAFTTNLFAAGGIETRTGGPGDPAELAAAFTASGLRVACLVATDAGYAEHAAATAAALKAAGAARVWLAGKPGPRAASDAEAGVDGYLHLGCDALAVLRSTYPDLEAAR